MCEQLLRGDGERILLCCLRQSYQLLDERMFRIERTHRVYCSAYHVQDRENTHSILQYCSAYKVWDRENTHSILGRRQCLEQRKHTDYTALPNLSVACSQFIQLVFVFSVFQQCNTGQSKATYSTTKLIEFRYTQQALALEIAIHQSIPDQDWYEFKSKSLEY